MISTMFWFSAIMVVYTYVVYPVLIWILASFMRRRSVKRSWDNRELPTVAVVIAVHNEATNLHAKLADLARTDYPPEKLKFIFSADGCTDETEQILKAYPGVELVAYQPRQGKAVAINRAVSRSGEDIIVFMDVRQSCAPDALRTLVKRLQDTKIGAVSGELVHRNAEHEEAESIGLYWRYEKWLRKSESEVYTVFGVTGALYAIRRDEFVDLPADTILDDFEIPIQMLKRGKRAALQSGATVYDRLEESIEGERRRKIRTLTGNYQSFSRNIWLFLPWRNPGVIQFISHKALRLLVPYFLVICFFTSFLMQGVFYDLLAVVQILFYSLAVIGRLSRRLRRSSPLFSFPTTFVDLNSAAVIAFGHFVSGRTDPRWKKA